jgi:hypothetical protein
MIAGHYWDGGAGVELCQLKWTILDVLKVSVAIKTKVVPVSNRWQQCQPLIGGMVVAL